jgi:hypothetical protein
VFDPPCTVLGDTEVFIHDMYREKVLRYSIYRRLFDSIVWPINHVNIKVSMKYARKLAVGYNNCIQDVDFMSDKP